MIDRLTNIAQDLLDASVVALDLTAALAPTSQFLTASDPAIDCEFVAVQVGGLAEADTSPTGLMDMARRNRFGNVILAQYQIWVVRCGPEMVGTNPPTDAAKTASAAMVQEDGWVLWNYIRSVQDDLFDGCQGAYFDGGVPVPEEGGFVGWQFQIRAMIEGYRP